MKRLLVLTSLALFALAAHAEPNGERWFGEGLGWYEHPCGLEAFAKYGNDTSSEVRRKYELALRQPEQCSKLFP